MRYLRFSLYCALLMTVALILSCSDQPTLQELRPDLSVEEQVPAAPSAGALLFIAWDTDPTGSYHLKIGDSVQSVLNFSANRKAYRFQGKEAMLNRVLNADIFNTTENNFLAKLVSLSDPLDTLPDRVVVVPAVVEIAPPQKFYIVWRYPNNIGGHGVVFYIISAKRKIPIQGRSWEEDVKTSGYDSREEAMAQIEVVEDHGFSVLPYNENKEKARELGVKPPYDD